MAALSQTELSLRRFLWIHVSPQLSLPHPLYITPTPLPDNRHTVVTLLLSLVAVVVVRIVRWLCFLDPFFYRYPQRATSPGLCMSIGQYGNHQRYPTRDGD